MTDLSRIKTFAINVKSNEFRKDHILAQAKKSGFNIQIFEAITPQTMNGLSHRYDEKKARHFTGRGLHDTEMACALSHIQLWRQLENDNDADYYLILEDDVTFETNIADLFRKINLDTIDFLKMSGKQDRITRTIQDIDDTYTLIKMPYGPLDAAAYIISKRKAPQMITYCETLHAPIDILMDRSFEHGIPVYAILPYPVAAEFCFDEDSPFYTSIGQRTNKYADDVTLFEKLCVRLNRFKGSIQRQKAKWQLRCERKAHV